MKKIFLTIAAATALCATSQAQILVSGGTYTQNFNSLASGPASTGTWADNTTLLGWYAARAYTGGTTTALGSYPYTTYRVSGGEMNTGWIYSYGSTNGVNPVEERAFGSVASGTPKTNAFGIRIFNDTANPASLELSYTGEQWRAANANAHSLAFAYRVSADAITSPSPDNTADWTEVASLSFISPNLTTNGIPIDGNVVGNRQLFSTVAIPIQVGAGQEIFLRWLDMDDSGNDHGLAIDDLTLSFAVIPEPTSGFLIGLGLVGMALWRRRQ